MRKKFVFLLMLLSICPIVVNAGCSSSELLELRKMASHVNANYTFDYDNFTFNLELNNLNEQNYIIINDNEKYYPNDGKAIIPNLYGGNKIKYQIAATNCNYEILRSGSIYLPYYNNFYNSFDCVGHEKLTVCNSEFLSYPLSDELFKKYIEKDTNPENTPDIVGEDDPPEQKKDKLDIEIFIKIGMVIIGVLIPTLIGKVAIDKVKYKF